MRAEAWWKPATDIAYKLHRWLTARRAADADPLEAERKRLLGEAGTWKAEQDRLQAVKDAEAAAEAKRQADAIAEAQALALVEQGMPELAEAVIEEAAAAPAPFVSAPSLVPTGVGFSHGKDFTIRVINIALVPREYLVVDEATVLKVVKAMKGNIKIPGIAIERKDATKGRRRSA